MTKYESINAVCKLVKRKVLAKHQGTIFALLKILSVLKNMRVIPVGIEDLNDILRIALDTGS